MNYKKYNIVIIEDKNKNVSAYFVNVENNITMKIIKNNDVEIIKFIASRFPCQVKEYSNIKIYPQTEQIMKIYYEVMAKKDLNDSKQKSNKKGIVSNIQVMAVSAVLAISSNLGSGVAANLYNSTNDIKVIETSFVKDNIKKDKTEKKKNDSSDNRTNKDINFMEFDYYCDDKVDLEDLERTRKYENVFKKYGDMYGIDYNLLIAQATQESGGDTSVNFNEPDVGIMQIEWEEWIGNVIIAYNYNTSTFDEVTITKDSLENLESHIQIATMILQNNINSTMEFGVKSGKISVSDSIAYFFQRYNYGPGNMIKLLNMGGDWKENRYYIDCGDNNYFEHVFKNLSNGAVVWFNYYDGKKKNTYNIKINNNVKKRTK